MLHNVTLCGISVCADGVRDNPTLALWADKDYNYINRGVVIIRPCLNFNVALVDTCTYAVGVKLSR